LIKGTNSERSCAPPLSEQAEFDLTEGDQVQARGGRPAAGRPQAPVVPVVRQREQAAAAIDVPQEAPVQVVAE
jgi:hypothetical protein